MQDQHAYNRQRIEAFRANEGKPGGPLVARPLLLLTTTGAKSGQARTSPLMYIALLHEKCYWPVTFLVKQCGDSWELLASQKTALHP